MGTCERRARSGLIQFVFLRGYLKESGMDGLTIELHQGINVGLDTVVGKSVYFNAQQLPRISPGHPYLYYDKRPEAKVPEREEHKIEKRRTRWRD